MAETLSPSMSKVLAALAGPPKPGDPVRAATSPAVLNAPSKVAINARGKYTPELAKKILSVMQAGNNREVACASAGVAAGTLMHWVQAASEGVEPFASFINQLDQTEASLEAVLVAIIRQKAQDDPHLAFKLLERRFPQRWAPGAAPAVNINMANQNQMTPADARAVMRDLFGDLSPKQVIESKDDK
jgi:hypothetical protein